MSQLILNGLDLKSVTRSADRGRTHLDWLTSYHSFSFGNYMNSDKMDFGALKVFNDDIILPGKGFGMHPHLDMEIISVVLKGQLEHRDNKGNHEILEPGDVQVMTAGSGIFHSEFNPSEREDGHFFQIWIEPDRKTLPPSYSLRRQLACGVSGFRTLVSGYEKEDSLLLHQDATVSLGKFKGPETFYLRNDTKERGLFMMMIDGHVETENIQLNAGDSLSVWDREDHVFNVPHNAFFILIDIPMN